ncbi:MAG TPA: helix-turn-helix transcriptional regulator [Balneolaceae bacterium]|nr:helix-turn-helix transcriptional regulator [Balneolaceae bacterium]
MGSHNISNNIKSLRFHNGEMTQAELAEKVDATRQTINAIEAAKYSPSLELALKIADTFDVPIGDVFWLEK